MHAHVMFNDGKQKEDEIQRKAEKKEKTKSFKRILNCFQDFSQVLSSHLPTNKILI